MSLSSEEKQVQFRETKMEWRRLTTCDTQLQENKHHHRESATPEVYVFRYLKTFNGETKYKALERKIVEKSYN